ncbi:MAG: serine/threonine-protein kinase, partial [Acidobacteriota bacterium]
KREVRIGRKLRHENLVQIYELVDAGESMAVIMEYLEGGNLSQRLADEPLAILEVERVAEALLEVLACLHAENIVHRDVKPSNVLFDSKGVVKLADLGTLSPMAEAGDLTATNLTVGTPAYMSPEQVRGEEPAPTSDLYSLGVTLYHLLAGKRPFEGGSEFDVARRQVTDEAPPIRRERGDCPGWLARFVHRLLEKEPVNRWKDAGEALEAFRSRRWRPTRRAVARWVAALVVVAVTGSLGLMAADRLAEIQPSVENGELVARSGFGRTLWRMAIEGLYVPTAAVDLSPEPGREILAGVSTGPPGRQQLEMLLFGRGGSQLRRFTVTTVSSGRSLFPGMSEELQLNVLERVDLGEGLGQSAVWIAGDRSWYPGVVGVWSAESGVAPQVLLANSGHCKDVRPIDIDGDGRRELVIVGVNNELGFQAFAAVVDPRLPGSRSPELISPETVSSRGSGLLSYVVLGEANEHKIRLEDRRDSGGSLRASLGDRFLEIEADGTIDGILMADSTEFWTDVIRTGDRLRTQGDPWPSEVEVLAEKQAMMWSRPEFRGAASLVLAGALSEGGRPDDGADLLLQAQLSGVRLRRVDRRLGEMYLLAGNRAAGREALDAAIALMGQGFGPIDELIDLALDDALSQDSADWSKTSRVLRSFQFDNYRHQLEVVVNFFGGRFHGCSLDLEMGPGAHHRAFVLKHWAAIEDGRADEETLAELNRLRLRDECAHLATLALARSEVLNQQTGENSEAVGEALWAITDRAPASWPDAAYQPLAQWAYGTVLEAEGNIDEALSYYRAAARAAPETFFGKDAVHRLGSAR